MDYKVAVACRAVVGKGFAVGKDFVVGRDFAGRDFVVDRGSAVDRDFVVACMDFVVDMDFVVVGCRGPVGKGCCYSHFRTCSDRNSGVAVEFGICSSSF